MTFLQLQVWAKLYLFTDAELISLPKELVSQLNHTLRKRYALLHRTTAPSA